MLMALKIEFKNFFIKVLCEKITPKKLVMMSPTEGQMYEPVPEPPLELSRVQEPLPTPSAPAPEQLSVPPPTSQPVLNTMLPAATEEVNEMSTVGDIQQPQPQVQDQTQTTTIENELGTDPMVPSAAEDISSSLQQCDTIENEQRVDGLELPPKEAGKECNMEMETTTTGNKFRYSC